MAIFYDSLGSCPVKSLKAYRERPCAEFLEGHVSFKFLMISRLDRFQGYMVGKQKQDLHKRENPSV